MRRTISQQSPAGLTAEPVFGPLVAPPVLVMLGKESGIAEIEPEHVDGLVQVEFLMQDAQIHKTLGDWHERVAVAGRSNGQALANGLVVRRGVEQHAHDIAELLPHTSNGGRNETENSRGIVQLLNTSDGCLDGRICGRGFRQVRSSPCLPPDTA
jgi:hypothetical protein